MTVAIYTPEQERAILATLGLNPANVETQALMAAAREYELDPLLNEIRLIPNKGTMSVYITRDGCLAIAHRHPQFDGMTTDEMRRNSTGDGFTAFVSVWRKDMSHPFRCGAQCKDTERQAKEGYGAEQALARAERRTLKRAFHLRGGAFTEVRNVIDVGTDFDTREPELAAAPVGIAAEADATVDYVPDATAPAPAPGQKNLWPGWPARPDQNAAHRVIGELSDDEKAAWLRHWHITDFAAVWSDEAAADALTRPFEPGPST